MRFIGLVIFTLVFSVSCQKTIWVKSYKYQQKFNYAEVVGSLDLPAQFPEPDRWAMYHLGSEGLGYDLQSLINYPEKALSQKLEGFVQVQFVVETDGYIYKAEVLNSSSPIFEDEAKRIVTKLKQWIPALKNNTPVRSLYKVPIYFRQNTAKN